MQAPDRRWQGASAHACRILMVMLVALMSAASTVEATESRSVVPAKAASDTLSAPANAGEYRMTPGDHVAIVVFNEPSSPATSSSTTPASC